MTAYCPEPTFIWKMETSCCTAIPRSQNDPKQALTKRRLPQANLKADGCAAGLMETFRTGTREVVEQLFVKNPP